MAIAVDPNYDKPQRIISTANLQQFAGVNHQLLIEKETNRPVIMDGKTLGGAFKCASKDELDGVVDSALTKQEANETYLGINDEAQSAKSVKWSGLTDVPNNVKNAVSFTTQTLSETQQIQALKNLGVIDALEKLITEYGGTVPTSLSTNSIQAMNVEPEDQLGGLK